MCSPVSRRAEGECNAITTLGFSHSEVDFGSPLESTFSASHKRVYRDQSGGIWHRIA